MSFKSINLIGLILIIAASFAMLESAGVFGVVDTNANLGGGVGADIDMLTLVDADIYGETDKNAETPPMESIKWYSYTGGKYQSNNSGKPIMVDVYADWCGWCKTLDEETYSDARVIELATDSFISVKVNGDDDYDFAMKYGIRNYPTILFTDSEGNEIHRVIGFRNADQFLADMETAMQKA
ncbi:MAG: thioredoxin family protein [Methanosarcinales archaeon]|nr:thioredoxin family protein [Methanosarcinales archaeon]